MTLSKEELSGLAGTHAMTEREVSSERVSEERPYGWLIHKAGRGWYRPAAQGYTNDPMQAGRYSHEEALSYSHPNGWDGPRDGITVKHESELLALRSSVKTVGVPIQPLETRPQGDDALEPSEIEVHEGAWALVMGTNAKAAGWIDTHALFAHQLYQDQILPVSALGALSALPPVDRLEVVAHAGHGPRYRQGGGTVMTCSSYDKQALEGAAEFFEQIATNANPAPLAFAQAIRSALEATTPQEVPSEVTDSMVERAWDAYDAKSGYSKPERFRAALTAALKGGK